MATTPPYKAYPEFVIKDTRFRYEIEYFDAHPFLYVWLDGKWMGPPISWEAAQARGISSQELGSKEPEHNRMPFDCQVKTIMGLHGRDEVAAQMKRLLEHGSYGIYTTNRVRESLKVYRRPGERKEVEQLFGEKDLMTDLESGYTVHMVYSDGCCASLFMKVPDSDYYVITEVETPDNGYY